jgi:hypothetical protein
MRAHLVLVFLITKGLLPIADLNVSAIMSVPVIELALI